MGVSFAAMCAILLFVDPNTVPPLQFVPIIGVVYVFSYTCIFTCIHYFSELKANQRVLVSTILAFTPTSLFGLMTLGTLAAIDVVLAVLAPALIAWYAIRVKS